MTTEDERRAQKRASAERARRRAGMTPRGAPAPCGTPAAYRRHLRHGEDVDDACRSAWNGYVRDRRAAE